MELSKKHVGPDRPAAGATAGRVNNWRQRKRNETPGASRSWLRRSSAGNGVEELLDKKEKKGGGESGEVKREKQGKNTHCVLGSNRQVALEGAPSTLCRPEKMTSCQWISFLAPYTSPFFIETPLLVNTLTDNLYLVLVAREQKLREFWNRDSIRVNLHSIFTCEYIFFSPVLLDPWSINVFFFHFINQGDLCPTRFSTSKIA